MIVAAFIMVASLSTASMAQTAQKGAPASKEHKCSAACTKDKHFYAHGEKSHKCTDTCKKDTKKS